MLEARWTEQEDDRETQPQRLRTTALWTALAMMTTILIIIAWNVPRTILYASSFSPSTATTAAQTSDCGSTVAEALTKGCRFDPLSFTWVPPECFDEELLDAFLALGPWQWYAHKANSTNETTAIPYQEVLMGEHDTLWVTREFHLYHCTYQWRKMHRTILNGWPLDGYIGNYTHTEHCEHILTSPRLSQGLDVVDVWIGRKFITCGSVQIGPLYQGFQRASDQASHGE